MKVIITLTCLRAHCNCIFHHLIEHQEAHSSLNHLIYSKLALGDIRAAIYAYWKSTDGVEIWKTI